MSMLFRSILAIGVLVLSGCGSVGTLEGKSAREKAQIRDYDRVFVADFVANDSRPAKDEEERAKRATNIDKARLLFADKVAEEITATKAFSEVSRKPLEGRALKVSGTIDLWEPGNVATRALTGFIGKSEFNATIVVTDATSHEEFARQVVDRNSWPLPIGASTTIVQTVEFFMNQSAKHVADELANARGVTPAAANPPG